MTVSELISELQKIGGGLEVTYKNDPKARPIIHKVEGIRIDQIFSDPEKDLVVIY